MKGAGVRISINNLPLIREDTLNLVKVYRDLQRKIKNQAQVNLTERLQETHQKIKQRITQLQTLQNQNFSDPRARFIEIMKLDLLKTISPADQLNIIADNSPEFKTHKLVVPSTENTMNKTLGVSRDETGIEHNWRKSSPVKSVKTPLKHQNTSKTPTKGTPKVPEIKVKDIHRTSPTRQMTQQNQLEAKLRRFTEQQKIKTKSPIRTKVEPKSSQRQLTKKEISTKFKELENKRSNIDSLQQLRLTIKMTKQQYMKFVRQMDQTEQ